MFEQFILPSSEFSFRRLDTSEEWKTPDSKICLKKNSIGQWAYKLTAPEEKEAYFCSANNAFDGFSTRHQAFQSAFKKYSEQHPTHKTPASLNKVSDRVFIIQPQNYSNLMLNTLHIIGRGGDWECYDDFSLNTFKFQQQYYDGIFDLVQNHGVQETSTQKQIFSSRNQIVDKLRTFVMNNLPFLYEIYKKQYSVFLEDPSTEDNMLLESLWWLAFVKPEVHLTKVFETH